MYSELLPKRETMTSADALVRTSLRDLKAYVPGTTVDQARRRYGLERIVKLSSNENPSGSSPRALDALRAIDRLNIYVDDDYRPLREKLAARHGVTPEHVVLGHGSNEILAMLFATFTEPGDEAVMAVPTFSLYRTDARLQGAVAVEVPLRDGVHDLDAMLAAITPRTKLVVVCDPNNPTGTQVEAAAFARFVEALPARVVLVLDQAYREYAHGGVDGVQTVIERENTVVLRTASKILGLAALRFGYGVATPSIVSWLQRVRLPFNVGLPALNAVYAALDDVDFVQRSIAMNDEGRAHLEDAFTRLGLSWHPTQANFIAVRVPATATEAYEALLRRGIIVRSGDGLRMPGYLRITIGTPDENALLVEALGAYLREDTA